jgi:hypothetical protein
VHVGLTERPARRSPSSRGRRRAIITGLAPPPVLQAQGTWKLPEPHIVELRPSSHWNPSFRGRAATAPPPPLAGDISGRDSAANRSLVSPIALLARLFASPSLTSPPASAPPPSGYSGEGRGHKYELSKVGRVCVQNDSSPLKCFSSIL